MPDAGRRRPSRMRLAGLWTLGAMTAAPSSAHALSCTVSATALAFGAYNPLAQTAVASTSTVALQCTGPGSINYVVTAGGGQSGSPSARYLSSGASHLVYQVYKDATHSQVFGDGSGSTLTYSGAWNVPNGTSSKSAVVYGLIPGGQNPSPGTYDDTLTLTATF